MAKTNTWSSVGSLWLSTFAASVLISVYVLTLAWFNIGSVASDPLEQAAEKACLNLTNTYVFDPAFGKIGIRDLRSENQNKIRSLNTVFALVRQSIFTSEQYHLSAMQNLAKADLAVLVKKQDELRAKLIAEVSKGGSTYNQVQRILVRSALPGTQLSYLKIELGAIDSGSENCFDSDIEARQDELDAAYVRAGKLRVMTPVAVPFSEPIYFHQQAINASMAAAEHFKASPNALPTALLITADYEGKSKAKKRNQICIICGEFSHTLRLKNEKASAEKNKSRESTCMALTFPQGRPELFNSLADLFKSKIFEGSGDWQQVANGSLPGTGRLAPPVASSLNSMNGREALGVTFYHWLRQLNQPVTPSTLASVIESPWAKSQLQIREKSPTKEDNTTAELNQNLVWQTSNNSCLASDSDARLIAYLHQTAPQEAGQKALATAFTASTLGYPPSAIPLIVDNKGNAVTPGRSNFDRQIIVDLLTEIYGTNLSAQETIATAQLSEINAFKALRQSRNRTVLIQADLASLKDRMRQETDPAKDKFLKSEIDSLETNLDYEQTEQKRISNSLNLAHTAKLNGISVAQQSFDLSSRLLQVCRNGINRLDNIQGAFLLGKRFIFKPELTALTEGEIAGGKDHSNWLTNNIKIFGKVQDIVALPDTKIMAEGHSLSERLAEEAPLLPANPETIIYDSNLLFSADKTDTRKTTGIKARTMPLDGGEYPFKNMPVGEKQLIFYAQRALSSGDKLVTWSTLARDYVAYQDQIEGQSDNKVGHAVTANTRGWFSHEQDNDPKLACEWQLRAPVVITDQQMKDALKGATLTNPKTGQRMPLVPPIGPNLM